MNIWHVPAIPLSVFHTSPRRLECQFLTVNNRILNRRGMMPGSLSALIHEVLAATRSSTSLWTVDRKLIVSH
jgi:hypothetical protein